LTDDHEHTDEGNGYPHDPKKETARYPFDIAEETEGYDKIDNEKKQEPGQPYPKSSFHFQTRFGRPQTSRRLNLFILIDMQQKLKRGE
jgi:hypothetical protein